LERRRIQLLFIENLIWILIVIVFGIFSVLQHFYFTLNTLISILQSVGMLGPLALGLGLCVLAGDFDVSLDKIAGLSAVLVAWLWTYTSLPWFLILLIPLGVGLAIGTFYGVLIGKGGMNAFLITLGGYIVWDSLKHYVGGDKYFNVTDSKLLFLGADRIAGGVFISSALFIGILLLIWFFAKYTRKGIEIYAVGASVETARRLGINTDKTKLLVHALAGTLAGLCGLFYVGYIGGQVTPVVADGQIFPAFIAIAIAGISIAGGRGSLLYIVGGAIFYQMIVIGTIMTGISFEFSEYVIPGILVLVAVVLNNRLDVFRDRIIQVQEEGT
jgi:ribose transport system permease protein